MEEKVLEKKKTVIRICWKYLWESFVRSVLVPLFDGFFFIPHGSASDTELNGKKVPLAGSAQCV